MPRTRRLLMLLPAAASALTLAACTSTATPPKVTTTTFATIVPNSVPNIPSERKDVALLNCGTVPGGWMAGGIAHNPTGHSATFRITIFFINSGDTDLTYAVTSVTMGAGKNKLWSAKATFSAPADTRCVLRGVAIV